MGKRYRSIPWLLLPLLAACSGPPPVVETETGQAPAAPVETAADPAPVETDFATPDAAEGVDGYRARATALLELLAPGADIVAARRGAGELMELGAAMVPEFISRHPHCEEYLDVAMRVRTEWPGMDLDTIEHDYHHDGVLPKIENSAVCYHMKDLVVHPATVLVLLSAPQPDYAKARAEVEEVISHAGFVEKK